MRQSLRVLGLAGILLVSEPNMVNATKHVLPTDIFQVDGVEVKYAAHESGSHLHIKRPRLNAFFEFEPDMRVKNAKINGAQISGNYAKETLAKEILDLYLDRVAPLDYHKYRTRIAEMCRTHER